MENTIDIRRSILHILDQNLGSPLLSDVLLEANPANEYVEKQISRAVKDESIKHGIIDNESKVFKLIEGLKNDEGLFVETSKEIAEIFYRLLLDNLMPSVDLLITDYLLHDRRYLAVLVMNYKKSYIHYVSKNELLENSIICQSSTLPSENQKLEEFLIFDLSGHAVLYKEKKLKESTENYISKYILNIDYKKSAKEKMDIIGKVADKVIDKHYPKDFLVGMEVRQSISDSYFAEGKVNIAEIAEKASKGATSIKNEFISEMKSSGVNDSEFNIDPNLEKKIIKKYSIKTGEGVEVKLPMDFFKKKEKFEIINNPDGTFSIIIKNVELL